MSAIKDALRKEADEWLTADHTISDWCTHCLIDPSDDLVEAFASVDMSCEDADEDEAYEDAMGELIGEAFTESIQRNT